MAVATARIAFLATMAVAAAFSTVRGFAAAAILDVADFGIYAVVVAIGGFVGSLIGLGRIEDSRKIFPRFAVDGRADRIMTMVDRITVAATGYCVAALAIASLALMLAGRTEWLAFALVSASVALGTAWTSLIASALRAAGDVGPLGYASLARAGLTLAAAVAGGLMFGFPGLIGGEALGMLAGAAAMHAVAKAVLPARQDAPAEDAATPNQDPRFSISGLKVYFATIAISAPIYLNRPAAAVQFDPNELGRFNFLMLFVVAAITGLAIIDQIVGPQLVRLQRLGNPLNSQLSYLLRALALVLATLVGGLTLGFWLVQAPLLAPLIGDYAFETSEAIATTCFCVLISTNTLDWLLQAHDRESDILAAAVTYFVGFVFACAALLVWELSIAQFIWALAAAKALQLLYQIRAIELVARRDRSVKVA